jgi:hypothetical protein
MGNELVIVIDRFEGDFAVVEFAERTFDMPRRLLPVDAKEGDAIRIRVTVDQKETRKRRNSVQKLVNELFE